VHSIGYVHCDVKPHNILSANSGNDELDEAPELLPNRYILIDFGISCPYLDEHGNHLPKKKTPKFRGSIEF
jgi:serine/threonine protein kinase